MSNISEPRANRTFHLMRALSRDSSARNSLAISYGLLSGLQKPIVALSYRFGLPRHDFWRPALVSFMPQPDLALNVHACSHVFPISHFKRSHSGYFQQPEINPALPHKTQLSSLDPQLENRKLSHPLIVSHCPMQRATTFYPLVHNCRASRELVADEQMIPSSAKIEEVTMN